MKALNLLYAFLGGAIVGCSAALLFAPEKGVDLRERIVKLLKKRGVKFNDSDVDALLAELANDTDE